ncbi:solute carrier family 49 member A3-like isoform X1 [Octopus vulgaris]|uniref:Solute carrier family 49 member A3-like isoform X1 n=1 Tax=Octopus vulgaris TaxID=6645 RepID=A0AA36BQU1_OCTVU|nr:solute carrier family 49 member A3-like isoform X1 [Octopus vulgaris]
MADINSPNSTSTDVVVVKTPKMDKYKVYKQRWYILAVISVINFSNSVIWITFSPVADVTTRYFNITITQVNWLSLVYLIATVPFGIAAIWLMDSVGLRSSIILSALLNCLGSILRVVSCYIPPGSSFPVLITGQTLAACAQPFILISPTKMAALWFKDNQRATANMLASMANPLGILVANLVSPAIVTNKDRMPLLLEIYTIPAVLGAVMATLGVCRSVPPTPPTASAEKPSEPFLVGLKQLIRNKSYVTLCLNFGAGLGLFTALSTLFQQILCPRGYDNRFSGLCGALFIGAGLVGAAVAGPLIDYTKRFEDIIKVTSCITTLCSILFSVVSGFENKEILIATSISLLGMFGFSLYPSCMEASVECTFPVAEATSSGLLVIAGQILGVIFIVVMQVLARPMSVSEGSQSKCKTNNLSSETLDFTISNFFGSGVLVLLCVLSLVFLFHPELKRLTAEKKAAAQDIISAIRNAENDTSQILQNEKAT